MNDTYTRAPHRRPPADMADAAALLIDFDNGTMGIRSNLGQELRNLLDSDIIHGKVAVQRAYADWRRYPQYIVPLSESSVDLIFAPAYGSSKKNATDIRLAIDALELVFTRPEIGTFILLSGDSDFSSLVLNPDREARSVGVDQPGRRAHGRARRRHALGSPEAGDAGDGPGLRRENCRFLPVQPVSE